MYTVDMFDQHESLDRFVRGKILTIEEVKGRTKTVISHVFVGKDQEVMFFSNNHCFMSDLLPACCVPCTTSFPRRVAPRPAFEDGWIETAADEIRFEQYCTPNIRILESVEELVDYLNSEGYQPRNPNWAARLQKVS